MKYFDQAGKLDKFSLHRSMTLYCTTALGLYRSSKDHYQVIFGLIAHTDVLLYLLQTANDTLQSTCMLTTVLKQEQQRIKLNLRRPHFFNM